MHAIALSLTGLIIIALKMPDFINVEMRMQMAAEFNERQVEFFSDPIFLSELAVLILGISLFVGARGWKNLYAWFQEFGLKGK